MFSSRAPRKKVSHQREDFAGFTPFREPSAVHSGWGRLRVHLPHWSGMQVEELVAAVRRLWGVTHAEANPLTGNVLILFEPSQTRPPALLEALPALSLDLPVSPPPVQVVCPRPPALPEEIGRTIDVAGPPPEPHQPGQVVYMTGIGRVVYRTLGWTSVGMAVVGAITPGIPTAPFVILAGYFFTRSSPAAHQWLRQSRWFGPLLRDWEEHRGIRPWVRNATLALIGGSMVVTAFLGLSALVTGAIMTMQAIGIVIVLNLHVIEPAALTCET